MVGTALLPLGSFLDHPCALLHRNVVIKLFVVIGDFLALPIDQTKLEVVKMFSAESKLRVGFAASGGLATRCF